MRFRYVIIFVSDLDRSVAFYRNLLGMEVREEKDGAECTLGDVTLALRQAHVDTRMHHHPPMVTGSCRLGFAVDDVDAVCARLTAAGLRCLGGPETKEGMRVALCEDPDGVNLTVASPVRDRGGEVPTR